VARTTISLTFPDGRSRLAARSGGTGARRAERLRRRRKGLVNLNAIPRAMCDAGNPCARRQGARPQGARAGSGAARGMLADAEPYNLGKPGRRFAPCSRGAADSPGRRAPTVDPVDGRGPAQSAAAGLLPAPDGCRQRKENSPSPPPCASPCHPQRPRPGGPASEKLTEELMEQSVGAPGGAGDPIAVPAAVSR
jgi:hypothetical protein